MIETLIVIAGTIISFLIGLFVLTRNPKQLINRVYAVMTLSFVVLMVANSFTIGDNANPANSLFFMRIVIAATTVTLTALYFLVCLVRSNDQKILRRPKNRLVLFLTLVVVALDLSPAVFAGMDIQGIQIIPIPGFGLPFFALHSLFFLATSIWILFRSLVKAKGLKRSQYVSILIGLIPVLLFAPITSFVLPVINHQADLIFLTPLYIVFFVAMVAYAMVRHGLFDIKQAATRTFAYILTLLTLSIIYYFLAYIISNIILGARADTSFAVSPISIIIALVLAFIFQPIKKFFDKVTNKLFYKDSYNSDDFFARLNQKLISTTELRKLLQVVANEIGETLKAEQAFFFIYSDNGHYTSAGTSRHKQLPKADALMMNEYISASGQDVIVTNITETTATVRRMMVSHRLGLILPLVKDDIIIGYLCLGEHRASRYTSKDIKVLETVADALVIAIQNALSVQEVRDLNATLQQRIAEATKELRASNNQLKRLDEAKDEFISMASHQLRTPLTSVKGYISMVLEGDVGKVTGEQRKMLHEAFNSSERMVHLINDFLNVSRLQTGKFTIEARPVNLAKLVEQELDSLQTSVESRGMKFAYKMPKNFPEVNVDESKISQVIMNFADNAMYYSRENSTINVKLAVEGDEIVFTVKDTGIGVPKEDQARLFTKFYRASNARTQRPDGTGVGLFLAKKVVDAHGGQIIFESVENKGSTFGFRLKLPKA
ncbi:MAG TPA: ATP-binding protein [Candidatus Saccharibacteria bacterium]|nr:ATP-binding protein [Candidatus Saccharibacteria bacterium]HRQ07306.1 ATP-binding protein [Candidatus Saccharibacteria bacterium]